MSALPDTTRLLLAVARTLHAAGYRRALPAKPGDVGERYWKLDTGHYLVFEAAPGVLKDQPRLTIRHGGQQIVWDGVNDASDAVTLLARLGAVGTCRTCDLPVPAGEVGCDTHARTTLNLPAFAVPAGRHSAHEAA